MTDTPETPGEDAGPIGQATIAALIIDTNKLASALNGFAAELVEARRDVAVMRALRRRDIVIGIIGLVIVAAFGVAAFVFATRLTNIAETNQANGRYLAECSTPSPSAGQAIDKDDAVHECYEAGVARQAMVVAAIGRDLLDAAICARTQVDEPAILICYRGRVAARAETEPGGP